MNRYHLNLILFAFALALSITIGSSQLLANKPVAVAGKLTNVGGAFICDCTNGEASCYCIN